jgi:hypothetical protein
MKKLLILAMAIVLPFSAFTKDLPKNKFGPQAIRLHDSHDYIAKNPAPDYWALSPYYVAQQDPRVCIIASFAMTLNAMRANNKLTASDTLMTQTPLLEKISKEEPGKRFYVDKGKSISLQEMSDLFKKQATLFTNKTMTVEVVHADKADAETIKKIEKILIENEKSANNFVIANFLQSEYTGDPEGNVGHVSPVAAYDAKKKRVLIMDSDREYYEPYWVSIDTFVKGLATLDKDANRNRGILWIH